MSTNLDNMKLNKPRTFAFFALFGLAISLMLFIGNSQMNSLKSNPLPFVNQAAQNQCYEDMYQLNQIHTDVKGINDYALCRGK